MPQIPEAPQPDIATVGPKFPVTPALEGRTEQLARVATALTTLGIMVRDRKRRIEIKEGSNDILVSTAELENEIEADFDPSDGPEQFTDEFLGRTAPIIERFQDKVVQRTLTQERDRSLATRLAAVRRRAFVEQERRILAATKARDDLLANEFARAETPEARGIEEENIRQNISDLGDADIISREEAALQQVSSVGRAHRQRVIELVNQDRLEDAQEHLDEFESFMTPEQVLRLNNLIEAGSRVDLEILNRRIRNEKVFLEQTNRPSSTYDDTIALANAAGEDADVLDLIELREDVPQIAEITLLPLRQQERRVIDLQNTTTDVRQGRFLARLRQSVAFTTNALQQDPIALSELREVIPIQPEIDLGAPETLSEAFKSRDAAARVIEKKFDLPAFSISPLKKGEVAQIETALEQGTPAGGMAILFEMASGLTQERAERVIAQIAEKRPDLAVALDAVVEDDNDLAQEILLGNRFLKDRAFNFPAEEMREADVDVLGGLGAFTPGAQGAIRSAAKRVYAARMAAVGQTEYDDTVYREALTRVAGGDAEGEGGPMEWNDRLTLPPRRGFTEDDLESLLNVMTTADLITFGNGTPMKLDIDDNGAVINVPLDPQDIKRLQLVHRGGGKYAIGVAPDGIFQPIPLAEGGPYIFDLRAAVEGIPIPEAKRLTGFGARAPRTPSRRALPR